MSEITRLARGIQPEGSADFAKGLGYAATKTPSSGQLPGIENADGWLNDIAGGIRGGGTGAKGFILEGKIVGRCGDEFYRIPDSGGAQRVIKLTKLDQSYTDVPMLDDAGNVVALVKVQVDVQGVMGTTGKKLFIDAKSAAEIGYDEKNQLERYAALAKQENGEVVWMLEGKPTTDFLNHATDMAQKYGVRVHILDADTGLPHIQWA